MSQALPPTRLRSHKPLKRSGFSRLGYYLRLTFINGPKVLLTARISGKCAFIMLLMCSPSLIFSALLTLPELIFQSPHQQAYFYFCSVLNEDPVRWVVLFLAGICSLMSLAVPATMEEAGESLRY